MKLVLAVVEEAEYFRTESENIKDAAEDAYLSDMAELDMAVDMEEE